MTQARALGPRERSAPMSGRAMFTIEASRTTMNWAAARRPRPVQARRSARLWAVLVGPDVVVRDMTGSFQWWDCSVLKNMYVNGHLQRRAEERAAPCGPIYRRAHRW